ncbi:flavodoxin domain-containing protein [Robertmurraya andreesenii]|uniref:Flavodoxin I n=1 Tax=Anoxybacillus andreesenii TaxID=1325932 RepID=A0ABT9UYS6_9BACL|nr:flavodoxin domain-containing protein [Robertmurraya andreesenii]MDQ0153849.1 flavodoxin I [Robertmurraya andreesenii]
MKTAIVYCSISGNTEEAAQLLTQQFALEGHQADVFRVEDFQMEQLSQLDHLVIGTYTWGNGEIPIEMLPLLRELVRVERKKLVTGIFGTGDSFYPKFCGAVDELSERLMPTTSLAGTLKIELSPQIEDFPRCKKFIDQVLQNCSKNIIRQV